MVTYYDPVGNGDQPWGYFKYWLDFAPDDVLEKAWLKDQDDRYIQSFWYDGSGVIPNWQYFAETDFGSGDDVLRLGFEQFAPESLRVFGRAGNDEFTINLSGEFDRDIPVTERANAGDIYLNGGHGKDDYYFRQANYHVPSGDDEPAHSLTYEVVDFYGQSTVETHIGLAELWPPVLDTPMPTQFEEVNYIGSDHLFDHVTSTVLLGHGADTVSQKISAETVDLSVDTQEGISEIDLLVLAKSLNIDVEGGNSADVLDLNIGYESRDNKVEIDTYAGHDQISLELLYNEQSFGSISIESGWGNDIIDVDLNGTSYYDRSTTVEILASSGHDHITYEGGYPGVQSFVSGGWGNDTIVIDSVWGTVHGDAGADLFDITVEGDITVNGLTLPGLLRLDFNPDEGDTLVFREFTDAYLDSFEEIETRAELYEFVDDNGYHSYESGDDFVFYASGLGEVVFEDLLA